MRNENQSLLRGALTGNGLFSIISGLISAVFAEPLGDLMGINPVVLLVVGIGVLGFGILTLVNARRQAIDLLLAKATVAADLAWVVGAGVIILIPDLLSADGKLLLGAVSAVVGLFAVLQALGILRVGDFESRSLVTEVQIHTSPNSKSKPLLTDGS